MEGLREANQATRRRSFCCADEERQVAPRWRREEIFDPRFRSSGGGMVGERSQWTPGRLAIIVFASNAAPKAQANHTQDIFFCLYSSNFAIILYGCLYSYEKSETFVTILIVASVYIQVFNSSIFFVERRQKNCLNSFGISLI
jgi:hypothetical protein